MRTSDLTISLTTLSYGLSLMNTKARDGGNPFANAHWDEAWKTSVVDDAEWNSVRRDLGEESRA